MAKTPVDWGEKDPNEVIKYGINFSRDLAAGDTLTGVAWTFIDAAGLSKASEMVDPVNASIARVTLSAGTHGLNAKLQVTCTTANGETIEGIAKLKVRNSA